MLWPDEKLEDRVADSDVINQLLLGGIKVKRGVSTKLEKGFLIRTLLGLSALSTKEEPGGEDMIYSVHFKNLRIKEKTKTYNAVVEKDGRPTMETRKVKQTLYKIRKGSIEFHTLKGDVFETKVKLYERGPQNALDKQSHNSPFYFIFVNITNLRELYEKATSLEQK